MKTSALSLLSILCLTSAHDHITFTSTVLDARIPKAVSDFTASLNDDRFVYLAGGCDAPEGNIYDSSEDGFFCRSLSDSLYVFDTQSSIFTKLADLPRRRYRHAAALVNNKLWLVGGRTQQDDLIAEIDIYDIESNEWTTLGESLPEQYWTSDHTAFAFGKYAYFVGGWTQFYDAKPTVFRIDTISSLDSNTLVIEDRAPLSVSRGDLASVVATDFALVSGGYTHANNYTAPLADVEQYDFASDTWTAKASLGQERGDKAMALLDGDVFVLGGETQLGVNDAAPGEATLAVRSVERFDLAANQWEEITELPSHRFRFAAVAVDSEKKIYTFGGQNLFNVSCLCYSASDEVVVYQEVSGSASACVSILALVVGSLLALLL